MGYLYASLETILALIIVPLAPYAIYLKDGKMVAAAIVCIILWFTCACIRGEEFKK